MDQHSTSPPSTLSSSSLSNHQHHNSGRTLGFRTSPRSSPPSVYLHSPSSPPARPEPLNLQARRLQLRNARFKGSSISPCKVSDRFNSTWRSLSPNSDVSPDKENQQPTSPNSQGGEQQQKQPVRRRVSILQEIHDSSQRGRKLRRPSVSRLFGPSLDDDKEFSSLNQQRHSYRSTSSVRRSSPYSVLADSYADSMMAAHPQNRSSPLSSSGPTQKNRLRSRSDERTTTYATERYIEHLETQLAAAQKQLSPMQASTAKPQVAKLRSLSAEIKVLQQEISEWEDKFDVRVHEEVALRTDVESKLRTKIIFLEGQLEDYTNRVKELECERDLQAQKLRNVESLRSTNRSLERRIDVLTELLAQSPAKIEPRSPEMSPTRSPGPRLSRPKSMLPSVSLGSDIVYQPLIDPTIHGDPEMGVKKPSEPDPTDPISDDSLGVSSATSKSQRSSSISQFSSSISPRWTVPLPFSPELQGKTPSRSRNMRRFPSGTCTLKPLILPTTATTSPVSPQRQSASAETYPSIYSPNSERTLINDANRAAQEKTLATLEGRTDVYQSLEGIMFEPEDDVSAISPSSNRSGSYNTNRFSSTLYSELAEVERNSLSTITHERQVSQTHSCLTTDPSTPMGSRRFKTYESRPNNYVTPKVYNGTTNDKTTKSISQRKISGNVDLEGRADIIRSIDTSSFGMFARTLVAGMWQRGMKQLAKFSWWILGLLLGHSQRDDWLKGSSLRMNFGHRTASTPICHACGQCSLRGIDPEALRQFGRDRKSSIPTTLNHTVAMWTKLSVAMIMTFGRAIRYGPASVLGDNEKPASISTAATEEKCHTDGSVSMRYKPGRYLATSFHDDDIEKNQDEEVSGDVNSHEYSTWLARPLTAEDFFIS